MMADECSLPDCTLGALIQDDVAQKGYQLIAGLQHPHSGRTVQEPDVRPLCTRAARGCPAGLPGRAKGAAQTVPDLSPHHGTGEVRSGTAAKRVRSGQQGKT